MQHELQLHRLEAGPGPDAGELDARALVAGGQPRVELAQLGSAQEPAHGDVAVVRFGRRRRWRGLGRFSQLALERLGLRTLDALGVCTWTCRQRVHRLLHRDPGEDDGGEHGDRRGGSDQEPRPDGTRPGRGSLEGEQRLEGRAGGRGAFPRGQPTEECAKGRRDVQMIEPKLQVRSEDVLGRLAADQMDEGGSQCVQVRSSIDGAAELLGRHVSKSADQGCAMGHALHSASGAEVDQRESAVATAEDGPRLDVAVGPAVRRLRQHGQHAERAGTRGSTAPAAAISGQWSRARWTGRGVHSTIMTPGLIGTSLWPMSAHPTGMSRLEEFAPAYEFNEVHRIRIRAPRIRIYRSFKEVTAGEITLFRTLTWIRRFGRAGPER